MKSWGVIFFYMCCKFSCHFSFNKAHFCSASSPRNKTLEGFTFNCLLMRFPVIIRTKLVVIITLDLDLIVFKFKGYSFTSFLVLSTDCVLTAFLFLS